MIIRGQLLSATVGMAVVAGCTDGRRSPVVSGERRLVIPPFAKSRVDGGRRVFDLDAPYMYRCHLSMHEDQGEDGPVRGGRGLIVG